jgi:hypothetical protein
LPVHRVPKTDIEDGVMRLYRDGWRIVSVVADADDFVIFTEDPTRHVEPADWGDHVGSTFFWRRGDS